MSDHRVKIFTATDVDNLQGQINGWLSKFQEDIAAVGTPSCMFIPTYDQGIMILLPYTLTDKGRYAEEDRRRNNNK